VVKDKEMILENHAEKLGARQQEKAEEKPFVRYGHLHQALH